MTLPHLTPKQIRELESQIMAERGAKGGSSTSAAKKKATRLSLAKARAVRMNKLKKDKQP